VVTRTSTICETLNICTQGCSLPGGEREQVAIVCSDQEVVLGFDLRVGDSRGREGGVEAEWAEEEGDLRCFGFPVEGGHWRSHR